MSITRLQLRQKIGRYLWADRYVSGDVLASPAPTANSFALAQLVDNGAKDGARYVDSWAYRVVAAEERRIITWTKGTGAIVVHRDWSSTPVAGDDIEIHRFPVSVIHDGIDEAMRKLRYTEFVDLNVDDGAGKVNLATNHSYIRSQNDIVGLYVESADGDLEEVPWSKMYENGYLYVYPKYTLPAANTYKIRVNRRGVALATDAATTNLDEDWVLYASLKHIYSLMIRRTGASKDAGRLDAERRDLDKTFRNLSRKNAVNHPRRLGFGTPVRNVWGPTY